MTLQLFADVVSLLMILVGGFLAFSASVGLLRFKDTMSKVHAVTKPQTVGLVLTVTGAIIRVMGGDEFGIAQRGDLGILLLLAIFALITSPVTAQRVARVGRREGLYGQQDTMSTNQAPADRSLRRR